MTDAAGLGHLVRMLGKAGEHIAAADLFMHGWVASMAAEGQSYDILAEREGKVLRVAVKSTSRAKARRSGARDAYCFHIERRRAIAPRRLPYTIAQADVVAMVALDTKAVAYLAVADCPCIVWLYADHAAPANRRFGPRSSPMRRFNELTMERAAGGQ